MHLRGIISLIALAAAVGPAWAGNSNPPPADQKSIPIEDYKLQTGDTVRVQIFDEPELDREVTVSQQGEIFLPLIGRLKVKDETIRNVQQAVRVLYDRDYIVNPQVNMMVIKYRQRTVNVMGAVNSPQSIEFPPDRSLTLIDAISRAGGFNRYANRKSVRLTRTYSDGHTENFTINADDLISGDKQDHWVLLSDDVIFVPESIL
jgi:polysaccharide export outer membrane protein